MIGQLARPCWYFEGDPWGEPHFPTEAAALEYEAEVADFEECAPRPVRRCVARCWVGECDRCGRPVSDDDGEDEAGWAEGHFGSSGQVAAAMRDAGWVVYREETRREVVAELTACPELVIAADRSDRPSLWVQGTWHGLVLVHRPTGRHVSVGLGGTVGVLHRVAALVAHLDWSSPDPGHYATGYAQHLLAAWRQATEEQVAEEQAEAGGAR